MTKAISSEALWLCPELKKDVYHCHCSNVFQCNHPSNMIDDDSDIIVELVKQGKIKITSGDPLTYGSVLVKVPGTGGNLTKWV